MTNIKHVCHETSHVLYVCYAIDTCGAMSHILREYYELQYHSHFNTVKQWQTLKHVYNDKH